MAGSHLYISGAGNIAQMITQLRSSFPSVVTADIVKRLGIAPNNESYVINALQFVGVLDENGKKTQEAGKVFSNHKDDAFSKAFAKLIQESYKDLFDLHGESTWNLDDDALITFFRQSDQTSSTIGKRQASVFKVFSALAGHGDLPATRTAKARSAAKKPTVKTATKKNIGTKVKTTKEKPASTAQSVRTSDLGLTVRVEINLPADGSKETYDNIFKSIRENLLS